MKYVRAILKRLMSPPETMLDFVSATMSILGLQTAMISRFLEEDDSYRRFMNTVSAKL